MVGVSDVARWDEANIGQRGTDIYISFSFFQEWFFISVRATIYNWTHVKMLDAVLRELYRTSVAI